jgi:hypothetical protein
MSKISDTWLDRLGPEATATLERSLFLSRCGGAVVVLLIPVMWVFSALHSSLGLGLTVTICVAAALLFFPWSQVLQVRARKQAARFLGLSESEWTQIAIRSTANFDKWAGQRRLRRSSVHGPD